MQCYLVHIKITQWGQIVQKMITCVLGSKGQRIGSQHGNCSCPHRSLIGQEHAGKQQPQGKKEDLGKEHSHRCVKHRSRLIQTAQRKNNCEIIAHATEQGEHQQIHR